MQSYIGQNNPDITVGVIGIGYVGLPLAICFSEKYRVFGYDTSHEKIGSLLKGNSYIDDISDKELRKSLNRTFFPTSDANDLKKCNYLMIAVPTPLDSEMRPDLGPVINATNTISKILKKGQTIILESTTYPGTMEEVMKPILDRSGLILGKDYFIAYSPERIDPGNKKNTIYNTPKIIGAIDEKTAELVKELYQSVISAPIKCVSNIKTAEATKIFENIFRGVNIALVNELSIIFDNMGINIWEVIDAAATKPMGFMPHYPGVGVGGHCIPVDPYYLSYKARKIGHTTRFIELAGEINNYMPMHTAYVVLDTLSKAGMKIKDSVVTVLGITYKPNTNDIRHSPSLSIIDELREYVKEVRYYDPYIPEIKLGDSKIKGCKNVDEALDCDCLLLAVDHDYFKELPLEELIEKSNICAIVDGKNYFDKNKLSTKTYKCIGDGEGY